jgi:predicted  nucleic acid-binding Zn-ribbon protein
LREWLGFPGLETYVDTRIDYTQEKLSDQVIRINSLVRDSSEKENRLLRLSTADDLLRKSQSVQQEKIAEIEKQLSEFRSDLKAKVNESKVPRPWDYESAQIAQLREFEEKPNGVR